MRGRDRKFYVLLAVFAFLFAMPANAVTISPGNAVAVLLTSGNEYVNSNLTFLGAGNVDSYKFEIASAPFGTITATLSFGNKGPFEVAWFNSLDVILGAYSSATVPLHFILDPVGTYFLKVKNVGASGDYLLSVTTTPLPPALILFGTALAGLTWLGRRRRLAAAH